jgi:quercetin dioxygenase-like cupin family protein
MTSIDPPAPSERIAFDPTAFRWAGIEERGYKPAAGLERGMAWHGITRHTLARAPAVAAGFESRYFELERDGYSSLEKHRHVHFVVALRGAGRALIGDAVHEIAPFDALYVPPLAPHRWLNAGAEPFGFLCTVDGERDRPQALDDEEWERLRSNPETAPYVF